MFNDYMQNNFMRKKIEKAGEIFIYLVEPGDNVWKISKAFNTKPEYIMMMNQLKNDSKLFVNQKLLVPVLLPGMDFMRDTDDMFGSMSSPVQVPIGNQIPFNNFDYNSPSQFYF